MLMVFCMYVIIIFDIAVVVVVDGCVCLFFLKNDKQTNTRASKRGMLIRMNIKFLSFSSITSDIVRMDIWHHALDSATSAQFACDVISQVRTFKYTLLNRLILRLRSRQTKATKWLGENCLLSFTNVRLNDSGEGEKCKHLHYEMQVIILSFYICVCMNVSVGDTSIVWPQRHNDIASLFPLAKLFKSINKQSLPHAT